MHATGTHKPKPYMIHTRQSKSTAGLASYMKTAIAAHTMPVHTKRPNTSNSRQHPRRLHCHSSRLLSESFPSERSSSTATASAGQASGPALAALTARVPQKPAAELVGSGSWDVASAAAASLRICKHTRHVTKGRSHYWMFGFISQHSSRLIISAWSALSQHLQTLPHRNQQQSSLEVGHGNLLLLQLLHYLPAHTPYLEKSHSKRNRSFMCQQLNIVEH
jgi:hypothetical protein